MTDDDPSAQPYDVLHRLLVKLQAMELETDERLLLWAILNAARGHVSVVSDPPPPDFIHDFEDAFVPTDPDEQAAGSADSAGSTFSISRSSYTSTSISRSGTVVTTHYF